MTDEGKAEGYVNSKGFGSDFNNIDSDEANEGIRRAYLDGLTEGRKNCMTVQNAMETIKRYCKEITDENNNCSNCDFCSKGFNGCKLQRSPCEWE